MTADDDEDEPYTEEELAADPALREQIEQMKMDIMFAVRAAGPDGIGYRQLARQLGVELEADL